MTDAKEPVFTAACAMKDIDIRCRFLGMALQSLDLMVLRMPTARSNMLIVLQMLDVGLLEEAFREVGDLDAWAGLDLRRGQDCSFRPVRAKSRCPATLGFALRWGLRVAECDRAQGVRLHVPKPKCIGLRQNLKLESRPSRP